jgi:hypothetical protein
MAKMLHSGVAIKDLAEKSLESKVDAFWASRAKSGRDGLVLLDICIQRAASQSRDWDGLARFFKMAQGTSQLPVVKRLIRAAFGDKLTYKVDTKHAAGGKFTIGWAGSFNLLENPLYAHVVAGIAAGEGWDDKRFTTRLNAALPKIQAKPRKASKEATDKVIKHLSAYMDKLIADDFSTGDIMTALEKHLIAKAVQARPGTVDKMVVNGATVFEPGF